MKIEQTLFAEALRHDNESSRQAFLNSACVENPGLLQRVQLLLHASAVSGDFLEAPPTGLGGDDLLQFEPAHSADPIGHRIGRYKLLEQIGEGGCGVVYMAEQEEPVRRRVALKIIRLGMATKEVIARFEAERQALAMMDHPNIARIFDAGATASGQPYFVMELVRGLRITNYCDEMRLSTASRLQLFILVCQAVQHAHQKGVIHRDLKPSNILVTMNDGVATPKVIDFGIAKAVDQKLTDKTVFTHFQAFIGTPAYTSPEQAEMSSVDIDTRSDIYSLGVLLYELLTGRPPFNGEDLLRSGLDELRRVIREVEPLAPSTTLGGLAAGELKTLGYKRSLHVREFTSSIQGDLDWIVMRCLEKDRARRYETADAVAKDIQLHLNGEPVTAGPPSARYRLHKLVRRHKTALSVIALCGITLLLGCVATTIMYVRAQQAQRKAVAEAAISEAVNRFLQDDLLKQSDSRMSYQWEFRKDSAPTLQQILNRAGNDVSNRFKDAPLVEAAVRHAIGVGYINIGTPASAVPHLQFAFELRKKNLGENSLDTFDSMRELALALAWCKKYPDAIRLFDAFLPLMQQKLGKTNRQVLEVQAALAVARWKKSGSVMELKVLENARDTLRRELTRNSNSYIECSFWLSDAYRKLQRPGEATKIQQELLELIHERVGQDHPAVFQELLWLADAYDRDGRPSDAIPQWKDALNLGTRLYGLDDRQTVYALNRLGSAYVLAGRANDALSLYENLLAARSNKLPPGDREVLKIRQKIGWCYLALQRTKEGIEMLEDVLRLQTLTLGANASDTQWTMGDLGLGYLDSGRTAEGVPLLEKNLEFQKKYLGWQDSHTWYIADRLLGAYDKTGNSEASSRLKQQLPSRSVIADK